MRLQISRSCAFADFFPIMNRFLHVFRFCLCLTVLLVPALSRADEVTAARGVLGRVLGESRAAGIQLSVIPKGASGDGYSYQAVNGVLTVKGSSAIAMCRGVYQYLRANRMGTIGWAGARLNLLATWPDAPLTHGATPFKIRHCYNVVTFGYTTPFWDWPRWQQELDWMAMHGYNMIMAPVATEAIATRVWRDLGLTQQEIDDFYTGPAHLPWQRMGNIQSVGGSLSEAWHTDQIALQKQLLGRMRELGIEPVVQSFAGFVPKGMKRVMPNLTVHETLWNGGFPASQRPVVLLPDDPVWANIMQRFVTRWKAEFGDAKYFLVDSFNEMSLPPGDPVTLLSSYGQKTYQALTAADADAVWVLQGWMFNYQRNIWNKDTVKALVESVPAERLLILDYANDYNPNWDDFSAFHGRSWVMGYVPNMGGKTAYTGRMQFYANQAASTWNSAQKGNLVGFTISGEGLENNEVLYELMTDSAWSTAPVDLNAWLPAYAANRYGSNLPELATAWQQLRSGVYSSFTDHPSMGWQSGAGLGFGSVYRNADFITAVKTFLSVSNTMDNVANYRDDAVEMAAIALGLRAQEWFSLAQQVSGEGDRTSATVAGQKGIELLLQADRLLESHSLLRLDRWIGFSQNHTGSATDKAAWEKSARQIVTVWGPPVNDYSCRIWSGLIRDFYVPRMQQRLAALINGTNFNKASWEESWVNARGVSSMDPYPQPSRKAAELVTAAYAEPLPKPSSLQGEIIGTWSPGTVGTDWRVVEWPLTAEQLAKLKGVRFQFTSGSHRLDIRYAAVVADGTVVAEDRHDGTTGDVHTNNIYRFRLPAQFPSNNSRVIRAEIRSSGGNQSNGQILLLNPVIHLETSDASGGEYGLDQSLRFTFKREIITDESLVVSYVLGGTATPGADYTAPGGVVSFAPGQTSAALDLVIRADNENEGDETVLVTTADSPGYQIGLLPSGMGTIRDKPSQEWAKLWLGATATSAAAQDADGDGVANLVEYFMKSSPVSGGERGALMMTSLTPASLKVAYRRDKNVSDVVGALRWSPDLIRWFDSEESDGSHRLAISESVISPVAQNPETVEATITPDEAGLPSSVFIRLEIR